MIKAIFFDADGTLLSHKTKSVPMSARKAIDIVRRKGIKCFLCTGRHKLELDDLPIADMEFDGYVCLNGQIILDGNTNFIWGDPFDGLTRDKLVELFNGKTIPLLFIEKDRLYINYVDDLVQTVQKRISSPLPKIDQYHGDPIYMACAYANDDIAPSLIHSLPDTVATTMWASGGIDIINKQGGKVAGIKKIQEQYGYTMDEIMTIGDGDNDKDMIAYATQGIAMGNALDSVKQVANYISSDIDDDGIWNALDHYHLLDTGSTME